MDNAVESVNTRLRDMLRRHQGLPPMRRMKAIFRRCRTHTENPLPATKLIRGVPIDGNLDRLPAVASPDKGRSDGAPEEYGMGIIWNEFHMPTDYRQ